MRTNTPTSLVPVSSAKLADARLPEHSEEAMALRFAEENADRLRWCHLWGSWFIFDGVKWSRDRDARVFDISREICRDTDLRVGGSLKEAQRVALLSARTRAAVPEMAKSDRRLASLPEQWDADPWILGTPGGIVDLRIGSVRPARPEDYVSKVTAVEPGGECPRFLDFLHEIMGGDAELVAFLQRAFGYCLTGSIREHALLFFHGTGSNGKSVLLGTVSGILGDHHRTAPIETFTASTQDRHPTDLAGLHSARLVTAIETEEGRSWAESRIKTVTGGEKISARFMRADFFDFIPTFKLVIAGNHKPSLKSVDEAMRRRLHLVPFEVTIPEDKRDQELPEKLKAEWPGIFAWMVEGCLEWQRQGLNPPARIRAVTADYLSIVVKISDRPPR